MQEVLLQKCMCFCSRLTALSLATGGDVAEDLGCKGDKEIASLVEALPQLQALELYNCAKLATDAGALRRSYIPSVWQAS